MVVAGVFGAAPPIVLVGPKVLIRTWNRKKSSHDAFWYLAFNAVVVLLFSVVSGAIVFSMVS